MSVSDIGAALMGLAHDFSPLPEYRERGENVCNVSVNRSRVRQKEGHI
jgi:hypothetical protein